MSAPVLITGGAGFIGASLADRLLRAGGRVLLFDDLSRASSRGNLDDLKTRHGASVELWTADVRDARAVRDAVAEASFVFHLAAQVAVTTSVADPVHDFEVNARGTLNVLEAIRAQGRRPPVLLASTNKVYGALTGIALERRGDRYAPVEGERAVSEAQPIDLHSPYGCSKGAADQYALDYARTFGIDAVVFRMSCIYGPRQLGTEDQGWIAHFISRAVRREPITVYGDGLQVRDALFIDDLVDAYLLAQRDIQRVSGRAFNLGGGPASTLSLLELIALIAEITGERPDVSFAPARPGDQRYYVSDCAAFRALTGWAPRVALRDGVRALHRWIVSAHEPPHPAPPGRAPDGALEIAS